MDTVIHFTEDHFRVFVYGICWVVLLVCVSFEFLLSFPFTVFLEMSGDPWLSIYMYQLGADERKAESW